MTRIPIGEEGGSAMKKKAAVYLLSVMLCLLLALPAAVSETRRGVIVLGGREETVEETLYESPLGFSFWYAAKKLEAYQGEASGLEGVVVGVLYSDGYMVLSMIPEEDAVEYTEDLGMDIAELSAASRVQTDVYREAENGTVLFLTVIAENGQYLSAVGEYPEKAADGDARYLQRVLDSVAFSASSYDMQFLKQLPGQWHEEEDGAGTVLTLDENGEMSLYCYSADGAFAYTCRGTWSVEPIPDYGSRMTLLFTSTDNPQYAGSGYRVECVYEAYTESWVEDDTRITVLALNPPVSCSGVSPFEEVYGYDGAALSREQGPNMRVVNCDSWVSLRETRSTSAKRLAKVPLGALVLADPEAGEANGFILCVYHDQEGFILSQYLAPVE